MYIGIRNGVTVTMLQGRCGTALLLCLLVSGCGSTPVTHAAGPAWTTGFWYWDSGWRAAPLTAQARPDAVFARAGEIWYSGVVGDMRWGVSNSLSRSLPPAASYWLVYRSEQRILPDGARGADIANDLALRFRDSRPEVSGVRGIQLDIDVPTARLREYAAFLRAVRKALPADARISITALPDWFRDGTAIRAVVEEVDEFVPQFYDLGDREARESGTIATEIDPAVWGPRFNRFGKPFRIGIATFGRERREVDPTIPPDEPRKLIFSVRRSPFELGLDGGFTREVSHGSAGELLLRYAPRVPGEAYRFTVATEESIRRGTEAVRRMGGQCMGVVYFRWPSTDETLVMPPDQVIAAASGQPAELPRPRVLAVDRKCAAVSCMELFLDSNPGLAPEDIVYEVSSSEPLEYVLPEEGFPIRRAAGGFQFRIPAYSLRHRIRLGRAVTAHPSSYTLRRVESGNE